MINDPDRDRFCNNFGNQLGRFLLVGGLSASIYAALSAAVVPLADGWRWLVSLGLYWPFILATFFAHRTFTFPNSRAGKGVFSAYFALQLICFGLVALVTTSFVGPSYILNLAVYVGTVAMSSALSFLIGRFVLFRRLG